MESDSKQRESHNWFIRAERRTHARSRLFCFPSAGGAARSFDDWGRRLPSEIEVVAVELPGRGTRSADRPLPDFQTLVGSLTAAIGPLLDRPFALFGHGLGALIAFELARSLRAERRPTPSHLFLSAHPDPRAASVGRPTHTLSDAELMAELRRWEAVSFEMAGSQESWTSLLPAFRNDLMLWETYAYREAVPLDCPLSVCGDLADRSLGVEQLDGWRRETTGPLFLHAVAGNHRCLRESTLLLDCLVQDFLGQGSWPPLDAPGHLPRLPPQQLHLWRIDLAHPPAAVDRLAECLAPEERRQSERFVRDSDRQRFVVSHAALRMILGRYLGIPPERVETVAGPNGKPQLASSLNMDSLRYNLSHSEGLAMVAVTRNREVGVDVEHIRPFTGVENIVKRFFAPGERAAWHALLEQERQAAFFRIWTRKEAYLKARGTGLSAGLDRFEVSVVPGESTRLTPDGNAGDFDTPWQVYDISPGGGYSAACAVEGGIERASFYDWPLPGWSACHKAPSSSGQPGVSR